MRQLLLLQYFLLPIFSLNLTCTKKKNETYNEYIICPTTNIFISYGCCLDEQGCCESFDGSLFWIFIALSIIIVIYFCITLTTQIQFETTNENTESGTSIPNDEPREFECPFCKSKILAPPAYSSRANLSLGNRTHSTCSANSLQTLRSPQETV